MGMALLRAAKVYPRECGGTRQPRRRRKCGRGLSPRVRGNHVRAGSWVRRTGSIPASAGEPVAHSRCLRHTGVYPRECGGTTLDASTSHGQSGLSPRVRGNHQRFQDRRKRGGSIPASAGEPFFCARRPNCCRGLSPRVRGNPSLMRFASLFDRSIPASAGEPIAATAASPPRRVYPRECGGTAVLRTAAASMLGLSPRVRGNRREGIGGARRQGSIPASAGEPLRRGWMNREGGVYPRECGGTRRALAVPLAATGLSPRVRGNPIVCVGVRAGGGSIPASAGEPRCRCGWLSPPRVYPRECGGTRSRNDSQNWIWGLSPRVRGNLAQPPLGEPGFGSIPASAGEPSSKPRNPSLPMVYPRECGGTQHGRGNIPARPGLSPRVRGNQVPALLRKGEGGSIPASAGEPRRPSPSPARRRVYPRECGGTAARHAP